MWKVLSFAVQLAILLAVVSFGSADKVSRRERRDVSADYSSVKHPKFAPVVAIYQLARFRRASVPSFSDSMEKLRDKVYWKEIEHDVSRADDALGKENPAGLTDDQHKAVFLYTMLNEFYKVFNAKLREGKGRGEFQDYVVLLMSALNKIGLSGPQTVWRVLRHHENHGVGDKLAWPAFSSTTAVKGSFSVDGPESTQYEIRDAYGYSIKTYSSEPQQEEILLPPNTELEVTEGPVDVDTGTQIQKQYVLKITRPGNAAVSLAVSCYNGIGLTILSLVSTYFTVKTN